MSDENLERVDSQITTQLTERQRVFRKEWNEMIASHADQTFQSSQTINAAYEFLAGEYEKRASIVLNTWQAATQKTSAPIRSIQVISDIRRILGPESADISQKYERLKNMLNVPFNVPDLAARRLEIEKRFIAELEFSRIQPPPTPIRTKARAWIVKAVGVIVLALVSAGISYFFTRSQEIDNRRYENTNTAVSVALSNAQTFAAYNTVDWSSVYERREENYGCVWTTEHPLEPALQKQACRIGDDLAAAQDEFRRITSTASVIAPSKVREALKHMEAGFYDTYVAVMNDTWYSRSIQDHYNEIMGNRFDELRAAARDVLDEQL